MLANDTNRLEQKLLKPEDDFFREYSSKLMQCFQIQDSSLPVRLTNSKVSIWNLQ